MKTSLILELIDVQVKRPAVGRPQINPRHGRHLDLCNKQGSEQETVCSQNSFGQVDKDTFPIVHYTPEIDGRILGKKWHKA